MQIIEDPKVQSYYFIRPQDKGWKHFLSTSIYFPFLYISSLFQQVAYFS